MLKLSLAIWFVLFVVSCSSSAVWELAPPADLKRSASLKLLSHCEIIEGKSNQYLEGLERKPFIQITRASVDELCGKKIEISPGEKVYVVRGLYIGKHTGEYRVVLSESAIWVAHESLAAKSVRAKKSAVVIVSSHLPSSIYVTADADE